MEKVIEKNQLLSLPEFEKSRKFWIENLSSKQEETRLPYSYFTSKEYEEKEYSFILDKLISAQLEKASKGNPEALFIILVASYRVLLYKYTGQQVVEIGIPVMSLKNQIHDFFTEQILPLINTLNYENTFKEILKSEKEKIAAVYNNQHYPLDVIEGYKLPVTSVFLKNIHSFNKKSDLDLVFTRNEDCIEFHCNYNGKLFSQGFIESFVKKFQQNVSCLLNNPDVAADDISLIQEDEENMLLNVINNTAEDFPSESSLVDIFKGWVRKTPDAVAVVCGDINITFKDLDEYSDKIAAYLRDTVKLRKEELSGILLKKSPDTIACILGILKAGGAYLPISPRYPADRIRMIINDSGVRTIISSKDHIKLLNKLQWECKSFESFVCIDSLNSRTEKEEDTFRNELNSQKLWEHVGESATDDIEGGGWQNSYTGENISREEMNEYRDNIVTKLSPLLTEKTRVLEIGCASGISMFQLAPSAGLYYGTDLSRVIIEKNKKIAEKKGLNNIRLKSLAADEIDQIDERDFDVVIINSVIQCFEGHNYFRNVIGKVVSLMKDKGFIFLGDVMDEDTRDLFIESLNAFKRNNFGKGYKVKTDFSNEIFYSRAFFEDLRSEIPGINSVSFSDKIHSIENELTKYRFDAVLHVDKGAQSVKSDRHKYQYSLSDLNIYNGIEFTPVAVNPGDAAYVIYTSGSTGKPKGVIATHRNVMRVVQNTNYVKFEKGDKILQAGPMEFDASTFDIWGGLTNGLEVHIIDSELLLNAEKLKVYIDTNNITVAFVITAAFIALVEQNVHVFDNLKYLMVGGEAMSTRHMNTFISHNTRTKICNIYGPTENTVFSTYYPVTKSHTGAVPIGRPISNSTCYVLDKKQRLVIPGAEGVLYVGGEGVAKGYLNSPELTSERFVSNPFRSGEKLYYTGDLVRWNENYEIEFLGRVDTQVKIRGFRIDLSEIENELINIGGIREARVILKKDQQEDKSLIGYFTASEKLEPEEVKSVLADKLPDYMIPEALMQLDVLPLNANGKLDVSKLPDPVILSKGTFELPANETEEQLAAIWKEVLGISVIGVNDNFFELGGHSLKAMKVLHKLSKDYELKLTTIFKYPTIKELSRNLVYKKGNLLETFKRLKKAPLSDEVKKKAEDRKAKYRERIKKDTFVVPGEEQPVKEAFLTGSTGFLGIHILNELLVTTDANVYVLIRAANITAAKERLKSKTEFFWGPEYYGKYSDRIHVFAGEMEKPLLGLKPEEYKSLSLKIDTIFNPAANVKHYGLETEYKGNTEGVQELVNLAKSGRQKRIHHVSTAGVSFGQDYVFGEYDRVEKIPDISNTIYLQSKLDAENIIFDAIDTGVEANIYRVGNLVFNNKTGRFQENTENSAFYMMLRSFINIGIMPEMHHKFYDFSFINTTAESIVKFAKQKQLINDVFHNYSTHTYSLNDLYHKVVKPYFPHVRQISIDEFPQLILEKYEDPQMKEHIEHIIVNVRILEINESNVMLVSERTEGIAEKLGILWQELDGKLAGMMVDFGREKKFW
jgi:amino acid adenylation domain-containing protein/thioester reductase-like protein